MNVNARFGVSGSMVIWRNRSRLARDSTRITLGAELREQRAELGGDDGVAEHHDARAGEERAARRPPARRAAPAATSPRRRSDTAAAAPASPTGVRENRNGATATGASPSTPPARRKVPRARLCSLAMNSSGVWIGASGTLRARAAANTSARVRCTSASAAIRRIAS